MYAGNGLISSRRRVGITYTAARCVLDSRAGSPQTDLSGQKAGASDMEMRGGGHGSVPTMHLVNL